jgi:hypothetical protein
MILFRRGEPRPPRGEVGLGTVEHLSRGPFVLAQADGDLGVAVLEHGAQQVDSSLHGGESLEEPQERPLDARVVELLVLRGMRLRDRVEVLHTADASRLQLIEAQPAHHRRKPRFRRLDLTRVAPAEPGLLHDVLGVDVVAQHPGGQGQESRSVGDEGVGNETWGSHVSPTSVGWQQHVRRMAVRLRSDSHHKLPE